MILTMGNPRFMVDNKALEACLHHIYECGVAPPFVEVGVDTFNTMALQILAEAPLDEVEFTRRQIEMGSIRLKFLGMTLERHADVPENRLWPPRGISVMASMRRLKHDMGEVDDDATGNR